MRRQTAILVIVAKKPSRSFGWTEIERYLKDLDGFSATPHSRLCYVAQGPRQRRCPATIFKVSVLPPGFASASWLFLMQPTYSFLCCLRPGNEMSCWWLLQRRMTHDVEGFKFEGGPRAMRSRLQSKLHKPSGHPATLTSCCFLICYNMKKQVICYKEILHNQIYRGSRQKPTLSEHSCSRIQT